MIILEREKEICTYCGGTGKVKIRSGKNKGKEKNCPNCQGNGWITVTYGLIILAIVAALIWLV